MPEQGKPKIVVPEGFHEMRVQACAEDFERLKKIVCETIGHAENVDQIHAVFLINEDRPKQQHRQANRFMGFGCFVAAGLVVVIFLSGIMKICELIWQ